MGEGVTGMTEELKRWIEQARELPPLEPYTPPEDPFAALQARLRGEELSDLATEQGVAQAEVDVGAAGVSARVSASSGGAAASSAEQVLGQLLARTLARRPLPGEVRVEVASRLAQVIQSEGSAELEAIWELLVYGESNGSEGGGD